MKSQKLNNNGKIIKEITIKGLVQGIGYRPFIAELASEIGLEGFVRNTDGIVTVLVCGRDSQIKAFCERIETDGPELAKIVSIEISEAKECDVEAVRESEFYITESDFRKTLGIPYIPPDIATCNSCERELFNVTNRRFFHPFISCTDCGPRYSIIEALPYDRPRITMKDFDLCEDCFREYTSTKQELSGNRRRHAQTIACRSCGPRLSYWSSKEDGCELNDESSIKRTLQALKSGKIVATMDIGGFHLACLASDGEAVKRLRDIKHRQRKPFAVLFESTEEIRELAMVGDLEQKLLESNARPVVLLDLNNNADQPCGREIDSEVFVNSPYLGAMLPCNPLQMILVKECGPLIMTSANYSGDLMIIDPDEMKRFSLENGGEIEVLYHNRPILTPLDDSVQRVVRGNRQTIRRARGYVPEPILLNNTEEWPQMFAAGGDMKATFGFYAEGKAFLSQPFGDMELEEVQIAYKSEKDRMQKLFGFLPDNSVCDKHPGYYTKRMLENDKHCEIYHHQAHVASVIAEKSLEGDVIGLAFDGTGFGIDGTIHGSEFYHWNGGKMHRFASLLPVNLQAGDESIKNANTILAGFIDNLPENMSIERKSAHNMTRKFIKTGLNTVKSSSMGRLFDAVSSLLSICEYSEYEGEAAIELEYAATKSEKLEVLSMNILDEGEILYGDSVTLLSQICEKIDAGAKKEDLALGFIEAIAKWTVETVDLYQEKNNKDVKQIALSGGTFQNKLLLEKVTCLMEKEGYKVYTNEQVSPGDGGLALGQMYLAR